MKRCRSRNTSSLFDTETVTCPGRHCRASLLGLLAKVRALLIVFLKQVIATPIFWVGFLKMLPPPVVYGGRIDSRYLDRSVYQRTFRADCRQRITATELMAGLAKLIHVEDVVEIGRTDGSSYNVTVASQEAAAILSAASTIVIGDRQVRLSNIFKETIQVRVHWLPAFVLDTLLEDAFSRYGKVVEVKRDFSVLTANATKRNGVRVVTLETDSLTKAAIPHLVR